MSTRRAKILLCVCGLLLAAILWYTFFTSVEIANTPDPTAPAGPIIAFGDSLTEGYRVPSDENYPAQLSRLIGRPVINEGVSGETAADALRRMDRDVLAQKPEIVLVLLGGNDLLQQLPLDRTFESLETVVRRCTDSGAMVVLIGVEGFSLMTPDYGKRFKELAQKRKCLYIPNILHGIVTDPSLTVDAVHPNGKGYTVVAERVAKALRPYLKHG